MRYLAAYRACPASCKGNVLRIRDLNPPLWARLTKDGPLDLGPLEETCLEVGSVWHATGSWECTRDLVDIRVPLSQLGDFRLGVAKVMETLRWKIQKDAEIAAAMKTGK